MVEWRKREGERERKRKPGDIKKRTKRYRLGNAHLIHTTHFLFSRSSSPLPFACSVKVVFRNELAEGAGVARGFYSAIAEALKSDEPLPALPSTSSTGASSVVAPATTVAAAAATLAPSVSSGIAAVGDSVFSIFGTPAETTPWELDNPSVLIRERVSVK